MLDGVDAETISFAVQVAADGTGIVLLCQGANTIALESREAVKRLKDLLEQFIYATPWLKFADPKPSAEIVSLAEAVSRNMPQTIPSAATLERFCQDVEEVVI